MKDTEYQDKLLDAIFRGDEAKRAWRSVVPYFEKAQELYLANLVTSVRTKADKEEILLHAVKLAALEDVMSQMNMDAKTGNRAQQEADRIESEAKNAES